MLKVRGGRSYVFPFHRMVMVILGSYTPILIVLVPFQTRVSRNNLPAEDLEIEILLRSVAKTLIRCTSVCTSWYSLIRSYEFITSHLNRSHEYASNNYHLLLLAPQNSYCSILSESDHTHTHFLREITSTDWFVLLPYWW